MKVTMIDDTPSQELARATNAEVSVTDAKGRAITLKKPGVLAQYNMILMLGAEAAANQVYVNMVLPVMFVTAIDGDPVSRVTKRTELDALIQRLDDEGIEAVMSGVTENFGKPNSEKDAQALKN
jgi:hypothetical protein